MNRGKQSWFSENDTKIAVPESNNVISWTSWIWNEDFLLCGLNT
jgi:hypothetical protein